ncbi:MAG TPA: hypothetical protein VKD71_12955 [Gemmataceae bacterium]|nr:hypothetical protein [Gemmataceae bacterium]
MCRIVLIIIVVVLVLLMIGAALVVQAYGWTGFLVFLAGLVVLGYVIRKAMPHLFMYMLTRPLKQMGAPLRGATIIVHSVTACEPPPPEEYDPGYDCTADEHGNEAIEDADDGEDESDDVEEDEADEIPPESLNWYWIEFTVTPPDAGSKEGGIVNRKAWVPQFVGACGPRPELRRSNPFRGWPPPDQFTDNVHHTAAQVWDGAEFASSEREVFGEHRIRLRIGVTREIRTVTITYTPYTDIGVVQIPRIDVFPDQSP